MDGATSLDLYAALPMIRFRDTGELRCQWGSQEGDAVFVPTGIRHPVLDFVIRLGGKPLLCNCSISADPSILLANEHFVRVLHAVDLLDDGAGAMRSDELAFAWVLPQAAYARFTLPGALKGASRPDDAVARRLVQYKLRLDIALASAAAPGLPVIGAS